MEQNPNAKVISLGIGDTTEPITPTVSKAMADAALGMGTREGYSGWVAGTVHASFLHDKVKTEPVWACFIPAHCLDRTSTAQWIL